jgi:transcriptional regulator GlxA family with amidase domain
MTHKVTILALDAVVPLDLAIAAQLMGYPMAPYDVTICGLRAGKVTTASGFAAGVSHGLRALAAADTVMVPGFTPHERALPAPALAALRRAYLRGARMVSICTGAFALAQAGILDGRRAATHWRHASELAEWFPAVTVDPDVLYVDQGQVLTSAGVAAGIDLCLHLIRADHGARAANAVARQVVVAPHRDGGQAQYIRKPVQAEGDTSLAATRAWAQHRLAAPMTVRDLARHANVSERTFARRFLAETGTTPQRWLATQRVAIARELLEDGTLTVEEIARRCGLGSTDNLRLYFRRHLRTTPSAYRRAFSTDHV